MSTTPVLCHPYVLTPVMKWGHICLYLPTNKKVNIVDGTGGEDFARNLFTGKKVDSFKESYESRTFFDPRVSRKM